MPFKQPACVPDLPREAPDAISIPDFIFKEKYGRLAAEHSRPPFICGVSGRALSVLSVSKQVDLLARGLARELGWQADEGGELDKAVCIFSQNTVDYLPVSWAVHRLGGVVTPANAQYTSSDLAHQLKDCGAKVLFTNPPLLATALKAAKDAGIPKSRIYLLELPTATDRHASTSDYRTASGLVELGAREPRVKPLGWQKGEGKRRIAFICYSSGTSGMPKGVMISHYNVITNVMQVSSFEHKSRTQLGGEAFTENVLGLLPLSHIYGLVMIAHCSAWRGDGIVILPKFDLKQCLQAIQAHGIGTLFLVPPVIIQFTNNPDILRQYNLNTVRVVFSAAAPLGQETAEALLSLFPKWIIRQGYGLTETCVVVSLSDPSDLWLGSAGSLITGVEARIISLQGQEVTDLDQPGELLVKSLSLVLGYLNNEKANRETFFTDERGDRWMRTGDEVIFKRAPSGNEHLFVVDRIKELIKVKGFQVAPAELEAHLLHSPYVADCAVIPIPDDDAGEIPKAYVVKSPGIDSQISDTEIKQKLIKHVEEHKAYYKWLKGGVEFISVVPKSPSGKILRRLLKDKEQERRRKKVSRL